MRMCVCKGKGKGRLFKEAYDAARGRKLALAALRGLSARSSQPIYLSDIYSSRNNLHLQQ